MVRDGGNTGAQKVLAGLGSKSQLRRGDGPVDSEHCADDSEPRRRLPEELSPLHGQSLHAGLTLTCQADGSPPHRPDRPLTPSRPSGVALAARTARRLFPYLQEVFAVRVVAGWTHLRTVATGGSL